MVSIGLWPWGPIPEKRGLLKGWRNRGWPCKDIPRYRIVLGTLVRWLSPRLGRKKKKKRITNDSATDRAGKRLWEAAETFKAFRGITRKSYYRKRIFPSYLSLLLLLCRCTFEFSPSALDWIFISPLFLLHSLLFPGWEGLTSFDLSNLCELDEILKRVSTMG